MTDLKTRLLFLIWMIIMGAVIATTSQLLHEINLTDSLTGWITTNITAETLPTDSEEVPIQSTEPTPIGLDEGEDSKVSELTEEPTTSPINHTEESADENIGESPAATEEGTSDPASKKHDADFKKKKIDGTIEDVSNRLTQDSKTVARFPLNFKDFEVPNLGDLKRREGESETDYLLRLNHTLSVMCTLRAMNGLEEYPDMKALIQEARLCTTARALGYEMRYLELSEEIALKDNTYAEFVKSTDGQVLKSKTGTGVSTERILIETKKEQLREANRNYNWITTLMTLDTLKKPEYSFLKNIWEHTDVDKTKKITEDTHLPEKYTELYYYIQLPQELLDEVVIESGGDPERFSSQWEVREWFVFKECLKNPDFLNFKK